MLKHRIISFPLLLALVGAVFFWKQGGPFLFAAFAVLFAGMAVFECGTMLQALGIAGFPRISGILAAAVTLGGLGAVIPQLAPLSLLTFVLCLALPVLPLLLILRRRDDAYRKSIGSAGVLVTVLIPLFFVLGAWNMPGWSAGTGLLYLILVTKSMDTGGYIVGMLSNRYLPGGNHKIAPSISPKKSYEGFFGGMALSLGVSFLFYRAGAVPCSAAWCAVAGILLAAGSFAGDLTESALKRACGIKDSGSWIPGMGGAFDVLDSFLYNGILFFLLNVIAKKF